VLGLVAARQPAVAVAVGMWEPAFDAGFQAPRRSCLRFLTVDPARHFHSKLMDSAHFGEKRPSGHASRAKRDFQKSRALWTFLQIVVQNHFFLSTVGVFRADEGQTNSNESVLAASQFSVLDGSLWIALKLRSQF
jgi:hypothetical protein